MMTLYNKAAALFLFSSTIASFGNGIGVAAEGESFEFPSPRNLGFFSLFASESNNNKFEGRLECDYATGTMCPPMMADPRPTKSTEKESVLETFSRCLDDPDDPECRELQVGEVSPATNVAQAPAHLRSLFGATLSPTTDDCGGNMFDPRFCASQMPSVSAAPTDEADGQPPAQYRIVATPEPTLCPDRKISPFVKTGGPAETCPVLFSDDSLPITVVDTTMKTVKFKLTNTFQTKKALSLLAVSYMSKDGSAMTCSSMKKPDVGKATEELEAVCDTSGFAYFEVYAASPGFKGTQDSAAMPEACKSESVKDKGCSYMVAIPCACEEEMALPTATPTAPPSTTPSEEGTVAGTDCVSREGKVQLHLLSGKCPLEDEPIVLASRTDKYAILELFQTWDSEVEFISAMFKQHGKTVCASDKGVTKEMTDETPLTYVVDCGPGDWATMYVYVKKTGFPSTGFVEMPEICSEMDFVESSTDICSYKVTVSCECTPEALSSFSSAPSFAPSFSPSAAPSFAPSTSPSAAPSQMPSSAPSAAPSAELETNRLRSLAKEGAFQCSAKEFGCDDGPNHVNICHYSSRIGYRTYCVPEADSEIVRFYSTDYCGPCTGGYAVGETGEVS